MPSAPPRTCTSCCCARPTWPRSTPIRSCATSPSRRSAYTRRRSRPPTHRSNALCPRPPAAPEPRDGPPMTLFALTLLLAAAVAHAGWNYIAKKAGGGAVFAWMFSVVSCTLYFPLALWATLQSMPTIGLPAAGVLLASIVVHLAYFLVLQRGYRVGDLSLVYPLARGTGPALAMLLAVL